MPEWVEVEAHEAKPTEQRFRCASLPRAATIDRLAGQAIGKIDWRAGQKDGRMGTFCSTGPAYQSPRAGGVVQVTVQCASGATSSGYQKWLLT